MKRTTKNRMRIQIRKQRKAERRGEANHAKEKVIASLDRMVDGVFVGHEQSMNWFT